MTREIEVEKAELMSYKPKEEKTKKNGIFKSVIHSRQVKQEKKMNFGTKEICGDPG